MFKFKHFTVYQEHCAMKVGTDGVLLGAWSNGGQEILDVGTGTGLIALMMVQRYPQAHVTAIDIDEGAVLQAKENVARAFCEDRVTVLHQTVQELTKKEEHVLAYDAVVCNPPYFIDSLNTSDKQRNLARHADSLTYGELMEAAWFLLKEEGELSVVVPFDYRQRMEDEAIFRGFFPCRVCAVKTVEGKPARRFLLSFKKQSCHCERSMMTIGDAEYQRLTHNFYL